MTLLFIYLAIALLFSFLCSIAEAVLLSVRPSFVRALEMRNAGGAKRLRTLKQDVDRPLAAILTINTIAHTVGAAGVGAQSAVVFGDAWLGVTSALLTLAILIFSEIIPKSLGAAYWQALALPMAQVIYWMTIICMPFVWMSRQITRLMRPGKKGHASFSRAELEAMAAAGAEEGALEPRERDILLNLMQLSQLRVREIMTPRTVIFACAREMNVSTYLADHAEQPFSRIPLYDQDPAEITGYVLKDDLLAARAAGQTATPLQQWQRDFLAVPDFLSVLELFDTLLHQQQHAALAVNEYGAVQGLVTQEDVFETLLGLEITDETDADTDMQRVARRLWRKRRRELGLEPDELTPPLDRRD